MFLNSKILGDDYSKDKLKLELQTTVLFLRSEQENARWFVVQTSVCLSVIKAKVSDIGLEPGDVEGAHFHPFRRTGAAEGMGRASSKISALKNGANENQ